MRQLTELTQSRIYISHFLMKYDLSTTMLDKDQLIIKPIAHLLRVFALPANLLIKTADCVVRIISIFLKLT